MRPVDCHLELLVTGSFSRMANFKYYWSYITMDLPQINTNNLPISHSHTCQTIQQEKISRWWMSYVKRHLVKFKRNLLQNTQWLFWCTRAWNWMSHNAIFSQLPHQSNCTPVETHLSSSFSLLSLSKSLSFLTCMGALGTNQAAMNLHMTTTCCKQRGTC